MDTSVPDDINNGPRLRHQTWILFGLALTCIALRCYVRKYMVRSFGGDDYAMLAAGMFAIACFTCYMIEISLGVGKPLAVIEANAKSYHQLLQARLIHMVCVVVGLSLVKLSVTLFLLRLVTGRRYIQALWLLFAFLVAFTVACVLTLVFQCIPVAAAWNLDLRPPPIGRGDAACFSLDTFGKIGLFNGVTNIVTDFLLAFLPIPIIWKLQLPLRARISLLVILSLGAFAAIAGVIRQKNIGPLDENDSYSIWNFIELHMGIITASLPALKPLFGRFFDAVRSLTNVPGESRRDVVPMSNLGYKASAYAVDGRGTSEDHILPEVKGIVVERRVQVS